MVWNLEVCLYHPESQRTSQIPPAVLILLIFISSRNLSTRDCRGRGGPHLRAPGGHASLSDDGLASMGDPERGETALDRSMELHSSQCSVTLVYIQGSLVRFLKELRVFQVPYFSLNTPVEADGHPPSNLFLLVVSGC